MTWLQIVRLGVVQASLGAIVVLATSTLNRVMVVELALPAIVPGTLVALHYAVQVLRPRFGFGSDVGGRRTPWILGGMAVLGVGGVAASATTVLMAHHPVLGGTLAVLAFLAVGLGVGAAGTSLLTLMADRLTPQRRGAGATIVMMMMIAGLAITAITAGSLLDPFTPARLVMVTAVVACIAIAASCAAVWGIEGSAVVARARPQHFVAALKEVWAEHQARRFAMFVFFAMLAYSAQELVLEPFAGSVFAFTPGQSTGLTGLQHVGVLGGMALVAAGTMWAGDRRGQAMRAWTVGGCAASALLVLALASCSLAGLGGSLKAIVVMLGMANGVFSVAAIGAMMGLASQGRPAREGTRMGLWGAAQALAFAAGGLVGTGASDVARHLLAGPGSAYGAVFAAESMLFVVAAVLAAGVFQTGRSRMVAPSAVMQAG